MKIRKKILLGLMVLIMGCIALPEVKAEMLCTGDTTPNLGTVLYFNCTTRPSISECWVITSTGSVVVGRYPEYPSYFLLQDKLPYSTSTDGKLVVDIFMNDKVYFQGQNYTTRVDCVDTLDNSTNSTVFQFSPATYAPQNWLGSAVLWLQGNLAMVGVGFFIFLIITAFMLWMARRAVG